MLLPLPYTEKFNSFIFFFYYCNYYSLRYNTVWFIWCSRRSCWWQFLNWRWLEWRTSKFV